MVVQGYVYTPGTFAYHEGMRLTDVLHSVDDLRPNADLHYVLIRRELPPDRHIAVVSADLEAALRDPGSAADVPLMGHDRITVFDLQSSRDRVIHPLLEDLKVQSNIGLPEQVVEVEGRANVPGEYPYEAGMTVRDLIRAGGGLSDAAYGGSAELTRYRVTNGETRETDLIRIDLAAVLRGEPSANLALQPFDHLSIKEVEAWGAQETVTLRGQVRFPGTYSIRPGETLKSVLLRAGGLTEYAFARGSVFTREELREREQKELDVLAARMQNDVSLVALQGSVANQASAAAHSECWPVATDPVATDQGSRSAGNRPASHRSRAGPLSLRRRSARRRRVAGASLAAGGHGDRRGSDHDFASVPAGTVT